MSVVDNSGADSSAAVQSIELPELTGGKPGKPVAMRTLDVIRNVPVKASVVLGSASIPVERLFAMKEGEVVELDQSVDTPVEVYVEGHLVAHGQIVVVGERFGVLITEISKP